MKQSAICRGLFLLTLVGIAISDGPSRAADGVIEINQASALVGGVTPGDAPGFPVTIATAGSYALTGDLTVSGLNTIGIQVTATDVTLDLRGFTIQGGCPPAGCTAGAGGGAGVVAAQGGIHVRNGQVVRFADSGVSIGSRSRISALLAERNGRYGIEGADQVDIVDSKGLSNVRIGIFVRSQSKVRNCVANSNGDGGIIVGIHSIVTDSIARNNTQNFGPSNGDGITAYNGSIVQGNVASSNQSRGIKIADIGTIGSLVIDNVTTGNDSTGIYSFGPGSFQGNTSSDNGGAGLSLSSGVTSGYRENVVNGNSLGTVFGGVNIGGNSCNGTPTCP